MNKYEKLLREHEYEILGGLNGDEKKYRKISDTRDNKLHKLYTELADRNSKLFSEIKQLLHPDTYKKERDTYKKAVKRAKRLRKEAMKKAR